MTGGTGFVGRRLLERLDGSVVLSREPDRAMRSLSQFRVTAAGWDPMLGPPAADVFDGIDVVFHLAGEPIAAGRWTRARKQRICDSRVIGTKHLVEGLAKLDRRPPVLVSASAVGYYGSRGDEVLTESSAPGDDFLADVCVAWEKAALEAERLGMRVVLSRTGVVLGRGGALEKMLRPFKLGLGGRLGSGRQWMPWIHLDDLVGLLLFAAEQDEIHGPMNAVAPTPITNRQFTRALAHTLHRPAILPAPYFGMRLAFGEFASVLFASQRVIPEIAMKAGFKFQCPEIERALGEIVRTAAATTE
ncbi:MAG TPA: TIGR01777 family oxidoreductase [Pirellulales bacterium]|nr:TIGR01777 family oxidoreductase [Pirellulales bacterium]